MAKIIRKNRPFIGPVESSSVAGTSTSTSSIAIIDDVNDLITDLITDLIIDLIDVSSVVDVNNVIAIAMYKPCMTL